MTGSVQRLEVSSMLSAIERKNRVMVSIALRLREIILKRKARWRKVSIETTLENASWQRRLLYNLYGAERLFASAARGLSRTRVVAQN